MMMMIEEEEEEEEEEDEDDLAGIFGPPSHTANGADSAAADGDEWLDQIDDEPGEDVKGPRVW